MLFVEFDFAKYFIISLKIKYNLCIKKNIFNLYYILWYLTKVDISKHINDLLWHEKYY